MWATSHLHISPLPRFQSLDLILFHKFHSTVLTFNSTSRPSLFISAVSRKKSASQSDSESLQNDTVKKPPKRTAKRKPKQLSDSLDPPLSTDSVKVTRRKRTEKKDDDVLTEPEDESTDEIDSDEIDDGEDISHTYCWPPLVCCFGAAQHAFVPSGRPANRLIDYEVHGGMKEAFWEPERFIRSPGGCAGSVAITLASLGGNAAVMGKLGADEFGRAMLYYLNANNVQTRAVKVDSRKSTAIAHVKISKRGKMKASCSKLSAEDSLPKSDINIAVLKEARMFYFTSQSLLEATMRATALQAAKLSKKFGSLIFFDVNLPLPLWQSSKETRHLIEEFCDLADIIEVTQQELEFLCGIAPSYSFDSRSNEREKFLHYSRDLIAPMWRENLKVLIVTNGTSKTHYYTAEQSGAVRGMEDSPVTPFTAEMSASGDGIVAGIMRMLTVMPHMVTDKAYLERTIHYAMRCGATDQWLLSRTRGFPPRDDMVDDVDADENGIMSVTEKEYRTLKPSAS